MTTDQPASVACRSCGASIIWAITSKGKRQPFDAEPNARGNVVLTKESVVRNGHHEDLWRAVPVAPLFDASQVRYMPHHATCPQGDHWRRP